MGTNGTGFVAALDVGTTTLRCQIINSAAETVSTACVQVSAIGQLSLQDRAVTARSLGILRAVKIAIVVLHATRGQLLRVHFQFVLLFVAGSD